MPQSTNPSSTSFNAQLYNDTINLINYGKNTLRKLLCTWEFLCTHTHTQSHRSKQKIQNIMLPLSTLLAKTKSVFVFVCVRVCACTLQRERERERERERQQSLSRYFKGKCFGGTIFIFSRFNSVCLFVCLFV